MKRIAKKEKDVLEKIRGLVVRSQEGELSFPEKIEVIRNFKLRKDTAAACRNTEYSTQTFWNAMRRKEGMWTDAEITVVEAVYDRVRERLEYRRAKGIPV